MSTESYGTPTRSEARFGIWFGCHGWLLGFLLVAYDSISELWPRLVGGAVLTAVVAFAMERFFTVRPTFARLLPVTVAAIGVLLLYYALVLLPAIRELPRLVERLESLGSVVEVPVWLGGVLVGVGVLGCLLSRRATSA